MEQRARILQNLERLRNLNVPLAEGELARIENLYEMGVLYAPKNEELYETVRSVAKECDIPIALVTIVDSEWEWFLVNTASTKTHGPREHSFCNYTILGDDVHVVEDLTQDVRYKESVYVKGEPHLRFYAGMPLTLEDGGKHGALCMIDYKSRSLTPAQMKLIRIAGNHVSALLRLSTKSRQLSTINDNLLKALVELEQLKQESVNTQKLDAIGRLVRNLLHEFNSPFAALRSATESLWVEFDNFTSAFNNGLLKLPPEVTTLLKQAEVYRHKYSNTVALEPREQRRLVKELEIKLKNSGFTDAEEKAAALKDAHIIYPDPFVDALLESHFYPLVIQFLRTQNKFQWNLKNQRTSLDRCIKAFYTLNFFSGSQHATSRQLDLGTEIVRIVNHMQMPSGIHCILNVQDVPPVRASVQDVELLVRILVASANFRIRPNSKTEIQFLLELTNTGIALDVVDNGYPIAPDLLQSTFEPFADYRQDAQDTGLGMYVCKEIIKKMGGDIRITSTEETGTTVHILIPPAGNS